jgi:hypothetical protein
VAEVLSRLDARDVDVCQVGSQRVCVTSVALVAVGRALLPIGSSPEGLLGLLWAWSGVEPRPGPLRAAPFAGPNDPALTAAGGRGTRIHAQAVAGAGAKVRS